jgi:lipoprotein NlpI
MSAALLLAVVPFLSGCSADDSSQAPAQLLAQYRAEMAAGDYAAALKTAEQLIAVRPAFGHEARAFVRSAEGKFTDAIADFTKALELDPKLTDTHRWRGRDYFKIGRFDEAVADFDRVAKAVPEREAGLWERGLAYYYAGRYADAVRQFTSYGKVDRRDIENGLWHFLSSAKVEGLEAARKNILEYKQKRDKPFPELLALYSGTGKVDDVLKAAEDGVSDRNLLRVNRFFAHYYVGKHYEAHGKRDDARVHYKLALGNEITAREFAGGNFMWHCARIDLERLEKGP